MQLIQSDKSRPAYYRDCLAYHAALIAFFFVLRSYWQWSPDNTATEILKYLAGGVLLIVFSLFLIRLDMMILSYGLYLARVKRPVEGAVLSKKKYYARAIAFDCFLVGWPVLFWLLYSQLPFILACYFVLVAGVFSIGYLEYALYRYDRYVDLARRGKWGFLGKV